MKVSRRIVSAGIGICTLAVVASCGPGSGTNVVAGKTAGQVMSQGFTKIQGTSFSFTSSTTLKVDLSKVQGFDPSQLGAFGPALSNGFTLKVDGTYESKARFEIHINAKPICSGDIYVAVYDGQNYVSSDGSSWKDTGTSSTDKTSTTAPSESDINKVKFTDKGTTTQNGQDVEDYRLDFNNALIDQIATAAGQSNAATVSYIKTLLSINGDGVDFYARTQDGLPEGTNASLNVTIHLTQLGTLLSGLGASNASSVPSGDLGLTLAEQLSFTNYGSAHVNKPASGGSATNPCSDLGSLGNLFGGLGSSTSGSGSSSGGEVNNVFSNVSNGLGGYPTP